MARCPVCKEPATQRFGLKMFCGIDHAVEWSKIASQKAQDKGRANKAAEARQQDKVKLERLKTRQEWLRECQTVFNKYIRLRDAGNPCISCGRHHGGQYHAGHYLSVGAHPELRFHPENCFLQCQPCNTHLSGNLVNYRKNLITKIGLDRVEWLEGKHDPLKLTIDEIKALKKHYADKCKEMVSGRM